MFGQEEVADARLAKITPVSIQPLPGELLEISWQERDDTLDCCVSFPNIGGGFKFHNEHPPHLVT